jgi:putative peptidoglycan lipid II flippase
MKGRSQLYLEEQKLKNKILIAVLAFANIVLGFVFQWMGFTHIGVGANSDALVAGLVLPQFILVVVGNSLTNVIVPIMSGLDARQSKADSWGYVVIVGVVFAVISFATYFSAEIWMKIICRGFSRESLAAAVELTRILILGIAFTAVQGVQFAYFYANAQFIVVECVLLAANLLSIIFLAVTLAGMGAEAMAWGMVIRAGVASLLLMVPMGVPIFDSVRADKVIPVWKKVKPLLMGAAFFKTDPLIERYLLSSAPSGFITLYYLAQQLFGSFHQVFNKSIANPVMQKLSATYKANSGQSFERVVNESLLFATSLFFVVTVLFGLLGEYVLSFIFDYKNFTESKIIQLWWIMVWMWGVLLGGGISQILVNAFYASHDTVLPVKISVVNYAISIPIKFYCFMHFGVKGLAIATSLYFVADSVVQYVFLRTSVIPRVLKIVKIN